MMPQAFGIGRKMEAISHPGIWRGYANVFCGTLTGGMSIKFRINGYYCSKF
jgi:hypothetical protein